MSGGADAPRAETIVVDSGSAHLAVSIWGGGDGRAVVALHPGVADRRSWQWCAPMWAAAGCRVVAYDRRGFGDTQYASEPHDDLADLLAVTGAADARPAVLVGNSQGGAIAVDHALAHPSDVAALVLIAPSPTGYDEGRWPTMTAEALLDAQIEAAEAAGDLEAVNRLEVRYWLDGVDQPDGRVSGEPRRLMAAMNGRALGAAPIGDTADRAPAWPRLAELTMPVLVACGEHDLDGCKQICDELAAAVPDGRRVDLSASAHCPQLDQPAALGAVVLEFLDALG
jgi:pimeloyl-ACP methyl ester carboxylesterase